MKRLFRIKKSRPEEVVASIVIGTIIGAVIGIYALLFAWNKPDELKSVEIRSWPIEANEITEPVELESEPVIQTEAELG